MGLAHRRLRVIERRLVKMGAEPMIADDEIDALDDVQADRAARAEGDRLAQLAQLDAETNHAPNRRQPPPQQGRLIE